MRFSGAVKPQLVWSVTIGRQVSTPRVLEPSGLFGRESETLQPPDLENVHKIQNFRMLHRSLSREDTCHNPGESRNSENQSSRARRNIVTQNRDP
jgi:hypothetical protein